MSENKFVLVPVKTLKQWAKGLYNTGWLWIAKEMESLIAAAQCEKPPQAAPMPDEREAVISMSESLKKIDSIMQAMFEGGFGNERNLNKNREIVSLAQTWLQYAGTIKRAELSAAPVSEQPTDIRACYQCGGQRRGDCPSEQPQKASTAQPDSERDASINDVSAQIINLLEGEYKYELCETVAPLVRALIASCLANRPQVTLEVDPTVVNPMAKWPFKRVEGHTAQHICGNTPYDEGPFTTSLEETAQPAEPLSEEQIENALEGARECIVDGFGYKYNEKHLHAAIRSLISNLKEKRC